jgi:hypothetical protein
MRRPLITPKFLSAAGAAVVLGVVSILGMVPHYSREAASGEGNFATVSTSRIRLAGVSHPSAARSVRSQAVKRPKLPLGKVSAKALTGPQVPQITVTKTSPAPAFDRKSPKGKWTFLTRNVRQMIDAAGVQKGRWKMIVVHSSATNEGSARTFDYYHKHVKHMTQGLAYHFVIGNGRGSGNGRVEVGPRWNVQAPGGHLRSEAQNEVALGICLVGNFQKNNPSASQVEALDELIDYLQAKVGKIRVTTHRLVNIRPTLCPGKNFPAGQFVEP